MNNLPIKNIAFYHFFTPDYNLEQARHTIRERMLDLGIRGSILLADEGINGSFAGESKAMDTFMPFLLKLIKVDNPVLKVSYTADIPFKRTLVKVKPEIVADPGKTPVDLKTTPAPHLPPEELERWFNEGRDMVLLDTRNDYEFEAGRFKNSVHLGTKHFADFEEDLKKAPADWKDKTIVTFCTGGIRCEKAAPLMHKLGFKNVYQLDGGILNYFEKVGRGHYEGTCFVFDQRITLDESLKPQNTSYKRLGDV